MDVFCRFIGLLFLLDLLAYLPLFSVFFGKIEENGYRYHRSLWTWSLAGLWLFSTVGLMLGGPLWRLLGTGCLFVIFRHYYIDSRWTSIRRGGGAPGFMSHWTILVLLLMQMAAYLDGSGLLARETLHLIRTDFAWIMICAGSYKVFIGYLNNDGMEYGRANPLWGYHWRVYCQSDPNSLHVRVLNYLGSLVEIVAGVLMLVPNFWLQAAAALSITLGFIYVAAFIRLGRLAFLMMALPVLYVVEPLRVPYHVETPAFFLSLLFLAIKGYIWFLPVVKVTQYYNLFANRALPQPLQRLITGYANAVPIIIWRVFTPDVTNFFIRIYEKTPSGEKALVHEDATYSLGHWREPRFKLRFLHVTESIALTSVFTTLKYFPSNPKLFQEKLLTYSRSLGHTLGRRVDHLRFEYVAISKGYDRFHYTPVGNFHVDLEHAVVSHEKLRSDFDFSAASKFSPLRESEAPGSYVAKG